MTTFLPTHSLKLTALSGTVSTLEVSLPETPGPAYTQAEWEAGSAADWEVDADGVWTFQGQACPGGVESVEVRPIVVLRARGETGAPLYALEIESGGEWLPGGATATWATWTDKARRSVMGGARRWRLTRADGSVAWEGRCAELPAEAPADKTVTIEGNDGALARVTVGAALKQGWLTDEEAATRRAPPDARGVSRVGA